MLAFLGLIPQTRIPVKKESFYRIFFSMITWKNISVCLLSCCVFSALACSAEGNVLYDDAALVDTKWAGRALIAACYLEAATGNEEQGCPGGVLSKQTSQIDNFELDINENRSSKARLFLSYPQEDASLTFNIDIAAPYSREPNTNMINFIAGVGLSVPSQGGGDTVTIDQLRLKQGANSLEGGMRLGLAEPQNVFFILSVFLARL